MKIKALATFTAFDGQMRVFNKGDEGELGDTLARQYIASGQAEALDGALAQLDHDKNGHPGGSVPHEPVALAGKKKAELLLIAEDEQVFLEDGLTNAEIVKAIEAKRSAASGEPQDDLRTIAEARGLVIADDATDEEIAEAIAADDYARSPEGIAAAADGHDGNDGPPAA